MTFNGVMGVLCVISATSVAFSAHCVKVVEDISKLSATEIYPKASILAMLLTAIFAVDHPSEGVKVTNSPAVVRRHSGRMT